MQTGVVSAAEGRQRGLFRCREAVGPDLFDCSSSVFLTPAPFNVSPSPLSNRTLSHAITAQDCLVRQASGSWCPLASEWFCLSKRCRKQVQYACMQHCKLYSNQCFGFCRSLH